jgi:hypothetical protein
MNINGFQEAKIIKTLFFSISFVLINTKSGCVKKYQHSRFFVLFILFRNRIRTTDYPPFPLIRQCLLPDEYLPHNGK